MKMFGYLEKEIEIKINTMSIFQTMKKSGYNLQKLK